MKKLFQNNQKILNLSELAAYEFQKQNYDFGLRTYKALLYFINESLSEIVLNVSYFENIDLLQQIMNILSELQEAQKNKDYILLGDLLVLKLNAVFLEMQNQIMSTESLLDLLLNKKDENQNVFPDLLSNQELLSQLSSCVIGHYSIEPTNTGTATMLFNRGEEKFYLHSNINPYIEARHMAEFYYEPQVEHYVIYGLDLGYFEETMIGAGAECLDIYESDLEVIKIVYEYGTFYERYKGKVHIHYDPDFTQFSKKITCQKEEGFKIILHAPSVRTIQNTDIRNRFEQLFIADSSIRNQKNSMISNFYSNIKNCNKDVQELENLFCNKDIYIIAAGPSLDKNITVLKNKPKNSIILAVGTVYKKLLKLGIQMDYVIFADANERVIHQIRGASSLTIPALILSTAYKGFAKEMQEDTYLICQKDYDDSEKYARENGLKLFRSGGSVTTTALDVSIQLGAKRILFLGVDLAYTNELAHAEDTSRREHRGTEGLFPIKSVDGGIVYASNSFIMYREWIERRIAEEKDIEFIDATEGGALIKGTIVCCLEEILDK